MEPSGESEKAPPILCKNKSGFETVPKEIKNGILLHLSDDERRGVRLVCTEWFSLICYSNFKIGCVLPSEMRSIITCLSRYNRPIGLYFPKANKLDEDSVNQLSILTNLTSIAFGLYRSDLPPNYLTPLTNLESISGLDSTLEDISRLKKLTFIDSLNSAPRGLKSFTNQIAALPKLSKMRVELMHIEDMSKSLIETQNDSNLTSLDMLLNKKTILEDNTILVNRFSNLKQLAYCELFGGTSGNIFKIKMPNLESLSTNVNIDFNSLPIEHLTKLRMTRYIQVAEISMLTKLQDLSIFWPPENQIVPLEALKELTALTALEISNPPREVMAYIQHLTRLKKLKMTDVSSNSALNFINFSLLEDLDITTYDQTDDIFPVSLTRLSFGSKMKLRKPPIVSHLTDLKFLWLSGQKYDSDKNPIAIELKNLTKLQYLSPFITYYQSDLQNLTNIKHLVLPEAIDDLSLLSHMKKMTHLAINLIESEKACRSWTSVIPVLTALRSINVTNFNMDTMIECLTSLRYLTKLQAMCMGYKGDVSNLTVLTRIQSLGIGSTSKLDKATFQDKLPYWSQDDYY